MEDKTRVTIAWLSWFIVLVGSGLAAVYMLVIIAFYAIWGGGLVVGVWAGNVKNDSMYTWTIIALLIIGFPLGAILGVRLWSKLMHRTGWISADLIRKMSSF